MKFVPANTFAGPALVTPMSATGDTVVVTCEPGAVPLLFVGFGSDVLEPVCATFVNDPLAGAVTVTVTFVAVPPANAPNVQVTVLPDNEPPPVEFK